MKKCLIISIFMLFSLFQNVHAADVEMRCINGYWFVVTWNGGIAQFYERVSTTLIPQPAKCEK